jgi:hypothetical protein
MAAKPGWRFVPDFWCARRLAEQWIGQELGHPAYVRQAIGETFWAACALPLSALVGYIGAYIFDCIHSRAASDRIE